ncbi:hypothetical protein XA68_11611 [Ophiocordyceps unilateralis]|uniref:Uncharacterized protein n=1 Tax=Ophiocordyceps unilateralis TaxID=268505 RepID=A0A2A9PPL1_OPHUN|nr:hypothetical protein XA68_11611 [Ophiocordyceps unilateralis]
MLTSKFHTNGGPGDRLRDWLASDDKENEADKQVLRTANSMTVLRHRLSSCTDEKSPSDGTADPMPHHCLKSQPSLSLRPSRRQCGSSVGFPRSLRNSSNGSGAPSSAFSGASTPASKRSTLRFTARKVSHSLRSRFRGLFGRPKSADDAMGGSLSLPDPVSSDGGGYRHEYFSEPGEASLSQVPSHVPSLHAVSSVQHLRSRQGSLESLHMEQSVPSDDKSRVTSWTNSSVNTVVSPSLDTEWERQRLSVIKENGMHVSSARPKTPLAGSSSRGNPLPPGCTVDSQRIYSALLKRLDETKGLQQEELADHLVPPRGISAEHSTARKWSPPTIRCVRRDDDVFRDEQSELVADQDSAKTISRPSGHSNLVRSASYQPYPKPTAGDGKGLSPRHKAEADSQPQRSPDRRSAFFASPTCHLFRTASPYRRALRENIRDAQEAGKTYDGDGRCLSVLSALSLPTRCPSTVASEKDIGQSDGESVYSCATPPQGAENDACGGEDDDYGEATREQPPRSFMTAHDRNVSSTSSVEWKLWLSSNVSKLETPSTTMSADSHGDVSYKPPAFGHVREETEIESPGYVLKPRTVDSGSQANTRPVKQSPESPCQTTTTAYRKAAEVDENSPPTAEEGSCDVGSVESYPNPWRDSLHASCHAGGRDGPPKMRLFKTGVDASPPKRDDHPLLRQRAQRRQRKTAPHSAQSSPGLTAAVEKQFGKADMGSPLKKKPGSEEATSAGSPLKKTGPEESIDPTWESEAETSGPDWEAQVMGSRRMVDLFLSSRRRRIESSRTETEGENMSVAFL